MKQKKAAAPSTRPRKEKTPLDRREFERVGLPATAFATDKSGNELGRVVEISGGGLQIDPASPWARLALHQGQQLVVTVAEPASGNKTDMFVEVRYVRASSIGLRFL
jgi:hypothetical protein